MKPGPLARAMFAFVACPGVVALALPLGWILAQGAPVAHVAGLLLLALGALGLLWCVREFYVAGRGTLAPWDPPRHLVTTGLYRFSRNPMYVAVALMLFGWAWAYQSRSLLAYALVVLLAFEIRIRYGEEPWLARTHGEAWTKYCRRTRRWI